MAGNMLVMIVTRLAKHTLTLWVTLVSMEINTIHGENNSPEVWLVLDGRRKMSVWSSGNAAIGMKKKHVVAQVRREQSLWGRNNWLLQIFLQMAGDKCGSWQTVCNSLLFIWHFQQVLFSSQIAYLFEGVCPMWPHRGPSGSDVGNTNLINTLGFRDGKDIGYFGIAL